jgi:hypothetical protein
MFVKSSPLVLSYLLLVSVCTAQSSKFKEYGQVSADDLKITECSFEKNADALLLLDLADLSYSSTGNFFFGGKFSISTAYYQRFKVFTERGTEQANFRLRFRSESHENITDIMAASYNTDKHGQLQRTTLAPSDVHYNKLNEYETEVLFTVPGVKKGSVFELTYYRDQNVTYTLPSWYFHSDVPSLRSTIRIGFLDAIEYYVIEQVSHDNYEVKTEHFVSKIDVPTAGGYGTETLEGKAITYTARNLPSVHDEPYMNSRVNYMDHLSFQLKAFHHPLNPSPSIVSTWTKLNSFLLDNPKFGGNILGGGIPRKIIKEVIKSNAGDAVNEQKAKAIFEFVRKSISWDGRISMMPSEDNAHTWKVKSGSSAEVNLLLVNTLRQEGLPVYPMLVGSRPYGYVYTQYPVLDQFKSVVAVMELEKDKMIILDATDKFLPYGVTKFDILNNYGYIVRGETNSEWYRILNESNNAEVTAIYASIDNNNLIKGNITTSYNNYSQANFRHMKSMGKQDVINERLKTKIPNATIESSSDSVDETANLFIENIKFTTQSATDNDGNIYISLPSIYGETTNPFVSSERISAVDFGYRQKIVTVMQLELPDGYELDSLFKNKLLITPDTSISFMFAIEQVDQTLIMQQKLEYKKSLYQVKDYPAFYEFHQQYYKLIQQPAVLRRKT